MHIAHVSPQIQPRRGRNTGLTHLPFEDDSPALIRQARRLIADLDTRFMELAEIMSLLLASDRNFNEACREIGIGSRKARYLAEVHDQVAAYGIPPGKIIHLGWTKLSVLAKVLTDENVDFWVKRAEKLSVVALQRALSAKPPVKAMVFKLTADEAAMVDAALVRFGARRHGRQIKGREDALIRLLGAALASR